MMPEVIVHHPIPNDLETVLRSLGYSPIETAEARTRFVCGTDTVSLNTSIRSNQPSGG